MRRFAILFIVVCCLMAAASVLPPAAAKNGVGGPKVLAFQTMVGVTRPYTGSANAIRGVPGGGIPWVLDAAAGELRPSGEIEVAVAGLVLAEGGNAGRNPIANFRAVVSCLSVDGDGNPITVNLPSGLFPADIGGNCLIEDQVDLPDPCIAPIVFVTSPTGSWFAATGF